MSWLTRTTVAVAVLSVAVLATGTDVSAAPKPTDYYTGLYRTGVDDKNNKLAANKPDPHWRLVGLYTNGGGTTYQKFQNGWGGDSLTGCASGSSWSPWRGSVPATTVVELKGGAGQYISSGYLQGNNVNDVSQGSAPWGVTSPKARWISINKYAHHYSDTSCMDLSQRDSLNPTYDDIYVFETKFKINAAYDAIDYNSIKMSMNTTMYVDNFIAMQVNGTMQLPSGNYNNDVNNGFLPLYTGNNSSRTSIWLAPGFGVNTPPTHNINPAKTPFHGGENTIRIYIRSNYSHMGFMIPEIGLTFDFNAKISVDTKVKKNSEAFTGGTIIARPNDRIQWRHSAWQNGVGNLLKSVNFNTLHQRDGRQFLDQWIATWSVGMEPTGNWRTLADEGKGNNGSIYTVGQSDVGTTLCAQVRASRSSNLDANTKLSTKACASIPYHYPGSGGGGNGEKASNGVTATTAADKTEAMAGEQVAFTYRFTNKGPTKSKNLNYRAYTFIVKRGQKLSDSIKEGPRTYAKSWDGGGVGVGGRGVSRSLTSKWQEVKRGSGVVYPASSEGMTSATASLNMAEWLANPGDQICSYVAVDKWSVYNDQEANSYLASNIACVRIGKKPQMYISGSDSYAQAGFRGSAYSSNSLTGNNNRGSYAQYGLLANGGAVTNFGSGGYTNLFGGNWSCRLTYRNTDVTNGTLNGCNGSLGGARLTRPLSLPAMSSNTARLTNRFVNLGALVSGAYYYDGTGELVIQAGSLSAGANITIYSDRGIRISSDIAYSLDAKFDSLSNMPRVTLVASSGDIKVDNSVAMINAIMIVKNGRFISCSDATGGDLGLVGKCSGSLRVNGAVISKGDLSLRRTFGGGNVNVVNQQSSDSISSVSEWFNYTPNIWLAPLLGKDDEVTGYVTNSSVTLPVRY